MDLLSFGMKYESSSSKMLRFVAKRVLETEKRRADRYEAYLNKTQAADVPYSRGKAALFQSIQDELAQRIPGERGTEEEEGQDAVSG